MSFSEVSNQSWFSRIGGSIKGVLVGGLIALVAFPLLFWNEGRAVHRAKTLAEGRGLVIENVPTDRVDPANEGKLVHMTGTAQSSETLSDPEFGISADNAIKLIRHVEMYQWEEETDTKSKKKLGGGRKTETTYSYRQVWSSRPIDSSQFHSRGRSTYGDGNPVMPIQSEEWVAGEVRLGEFKLAEDQVGRISNYQPIELEMPEAESDATADVAEDKVPTLDELLAEPDPQEEMEKARSIENKQLVENQFYLGKDPVNPAIGDLRVWFEEVGPSEISFAYQQRGDSFVPYKTKNGSLSLFNNGNASAEKLFSDAETANTMLLWGLRLAGFAVMALGIFLVLRPLAVLGDVVPFLGGLVGIGVAVVAIAVAAGLSLVTIGIAWLFYRPLLGIGLLVAAGALLFFARRYLSRRAKVIEVHQPVVVG